MEVISCGVQSRELNQKVKPRMDCAVLIVGGRLYQHCEAPPGEENMHLSLDYGLFITHPVQFENCQ